MASLWPFVRNEIKKTFVEPAIYQYIIEHNAPQKNFLHEIAYTSHTQEKRIVLGDALDTNAYHFFFYMIARFYYFDTGDNDIIYYYPTRNENNYLAEKALSLLPSRFKRETEKAPNIEYIEMPGCEWFHDYIGEPWIYSYVRDLFKDIWEGVKQEKGKYTYISRNKRELRVRRCANEEALLPHLKTLGFSVYTMEHMTFEQQIKLFRSSEIITGVHGAGFAWLIFCHPGTAFVEIYKPIQKRHYEDISMKCQLDYTKFVAVHEPTKEEFPESNIDDCWVNVESYISTLKGIVAERESIN